MKVAGKRTLCRSWLAVLKDLVSDGILSKADAADIASARRSRDEALLHPLEIIVAQTAAACHRWSGR